MSDYLEIANDPVLWLICIPAIALVALQAFLFSKRAIHASSTTSLSKSDCFRAFKVGAISAIGPSLSVFVVMLGMMAVIGGPVTWLRLSFIGAAPTELTASTIGAKAMGVEFGSPEYGITAFSASVWTMTLNACGWLLFCGLFTHKLDQLQDRVAKGNAELMTQIAGAAVLGTASYLVMSNAKKGMSSLVAAVVSAIIMVLLTKFSHKFPGLKEYNLGIAMVAGMFAAVII